MERVEIDYRGHRLVALAYNRMHPGTPIVLVHGLLSSVYSWYPKQLSFLFRFGPVYSVALPAHAPSVPPPDLERVDEALLTGAMAAQIDHLAGNRPVFLIGHSTGGNAALLFAIAHPERVRGVITIGTAHSGKEESGVYGAVQWANQHLGALGGWLVTGMLRVNSLSPRLHKVFLADMAAEPRRLLEHPDLDDYVESYFRLQKELDAKAMTAYFRDLIHMDLESRLRTLPVPVLVMRGDQDPFVSQARTQYLLDCLPHGELCLIPQCGHLPMFEQYERYVREVSRFIEAQNGAGAEPPPEGGTAPDANPGP